VDRFVNEDIQKDVNRSPNPVTKRDPGPWPAMSEMGIPA